MLYKYINVIINYYNLIKRPLNKIFDLFSINKNLNGWSAINLSFFIWNKLKEQICKITAPKQKQTKNKKVESGAKFIYTVFEKTYDKFNLIYDLSFFF